MSRALVSQQCCPGSNPGVDAMRGLSLLLVLSRLPRGFSSGTPVLPLLQNQHFQIPIRSGTHGHNSTSSYELLSAPWVNTLQFNTIIHFNDLAEAIEAAVTTEWIAIHTFFLQFDWSGDHNVTNDNPRKTVGNSRLVREDNGTIIFFFWLKDVCLTRAQNIVNCGSASNRKNIIITFLILSKRLWLIKTHF